MTIALLSNVTITSLAMSVNRLAREEVFYPHGYNTWIQELSNPDSDLYRSGAKSIFILLHARELLGESGLQGIDKAEAILSPMLQAIVQATQAHPDIHIVVSTLDIPQRKIHPLVSKRPEIQIGAFWRNTLEQYEIPILELSEIAADMGRNNFYNNRVWYMGSMPFSKAGEESLATEIHRIWKSIHGPRKKCLALDLDNTLWGGVIGELGTEAVHLDSVGSGARFYDFQRRILDLKTSGVMLAILSKNNREDALDGINNHPSMLLREKDFVAIRANWEPKAQNLQSVADELNIGTDSFVFIDDNPVEREMMQIALPEVAVPVFPEDTAQLENFILDVAREYFLQFKETSEDLSKTEQYMAEARRQEQKSAFQNVEDYLKSLDMQLTVETLNERNVTRAAQLTQKTNQFNLTTRRYSESDMRAMIGDPSRQVYIGQLTDRFGDYGKIILCIAKLASTKATIDTFLMSCRVMSRGVEGAFLHAIQESLYGKHIDIIETSFIPTPKNSIVKNFWKDMGYQEMGNTPEGISAFSLELPSAETNDTSVISVDMR